VTENVLDSIVSGVTTTEEIEAEPYGFRVTWIRWDSGFRDSGLRMGDRVVPCNSVHYERERRTEFRHKAIGARATSASEVQNRSKSLT